jgi:hypothetical protein
MLPEPGDNLGFEAMPRPNSEAGFMLQPKSAFVLRRRADHKPISIVFSCFVGGAKRHVKLGGKEPSDNVDYKDVIFTPGFSKSQ